MLEGATKMVAPFNFLHRFLCLLLISKKEGNKFPLFFNSAKN